MTWENGFVLMMTVITTLVGKWVWDRWLSQSSRVTADSCNSKREACVGRIMTALEKHTDRLSYVDKSFQDINSELTRISLALQVIMVTNIELCRHAHLDCDELSKTLMKYGFLE